MGKARLTEWIAVAGMMLVIVAMLGVCVVFCVRGFAGTCQALANMVQIGQVRVVAAERPVIAAKDKASMYLVCKYKYGGDQQGLSDVAHSRAVVLTAPTRVRVIEQAWSWPYWGYDP
jgi:hypothetical protein